MVSEHGGAVAVVGPPQQIDMIGGQRPGSEGGGGVGHRTQLTGPAQLYFG
jgi:hypothetical protein